MHLLALGSLWQSWQGAQEEPVWVELENRRPSLAWTRRREPFARKHQLFRRFLRLPRQLQSVRFSQAVILRSDCAHWTCTSTG